VSSVTFRLVDWQAADHIILEANPNASIQPKTKRLAIRHMAEPATESLLLKKGDLDIARTLEAWPGFVKNPPHVGLSC
jgi:peptide/nickel transport system substrate-binding protein